MCEHTKNGAGSTAEDVIGREDMEEYSSFCYWRLPLDEVFPRDVDFGYTLDEEIKEEFTSEEEETDDIVAAMDKEVVEMDGNIEFSSYNYWREEIHCSELFPTDVDWGDKTEKIKEEVTDDKETNDIVTIVDKEDSVEMDGNMEMFSCYNYWMQPIHVPINVNSLLNDPQEHLVEDKADIMVGSTEDKSYIGGVTKVIKSGDKNCEKINVRQKQDLCSGKRRITCRKTETYISDKQRLMSLLKEKENLLKVEREKTILVHNDYYAKLKILEELEENDAREKEEKAKRIMDGKNSNSKSISSNPSQLVSENNILKSGEIIDIDSEESDVDIKCAPLFSNMNDSNLAMTGVTLSLPQLLSLT